MAKEKKFKEDTLTQQAGLLEITYYTDPLCCWSWGLEPQWRRLLFEYKEYISVRYCMAGLLPGWKNYHDAVNNVSKPIQMGPVWMQAKQLTGMPIEYNLWMRDPPSSSYPACIAVKSVGIQSPKAEAIYLRLLREKVMVEGQNIARPEVLQDGAMQLQKLMRGFSIDQFNEDIKNEKALEAFRKDLNEVQYHQIKRFPSLVIKNQQNNAIIISGHRPYNVLIDSIKKICPELPIPTPFNLADYKAYWPFFVERELEEISGQVG